MNLETVPCGLCGGTNAEPLFEAENSRLRVTGQKFWLQRCRSCGLVYTSPRPSLEEMGPFYCGEYYTPESSALVKWLGDYFDRERVCYARQSKSGGKVLDVGCGGGVFLDLMASAGFDVHGLEPSESARDHLPPAIRDRVQFGPFENAKFQENSFDLVTLWHVLEHVPAPLDTLIKARELLGPGGELVVEVPNYGSIEARWLGPFWFALDVPRHFWHFTPATLRSMAEKAGFRQISIEASSWKHPLYVGSYLLSLRPGIECWEKVHLSAFARWKPARLVLNVLGLLACLLGRLGPGSLPIIRLRAGK